MIFWYGGHVENCTLLDYYATSSGNSLPKFRDNLSVLSSGVKNQKQIIAPEDGTNFGKKVPLIAT
jgi:hypothetical protein